MAKNGPREYVTLYCTECNEQRKIKSENYRTQKNKRNTTELLQLKKYCPKCNKTILHKEKK